LNQVLRVHFFKDLNVTCLSFKKYFLGQKLLKLKLLKILRSKLPKSTYRDRFRDNKYTSIQKFFNLKKCSGKRILTVSFFALNPSLNALLQPQHENDL
jgi:hypothetical protein